MNREQCVWKYVFVMNYSYARDLVVLPRSLSQIGVEEFAWEFALSKMGKKCFACFASKIRFVFFFTIITANYFKSGFNGMLFARGWCGMLMIFLVIFSIYIFMSNNSKKTKTLSEYHFILNVFHCQSKIEPFIIFIWVSFK